MPNNRIKADAEKRGGATRQGHWRRGLCGALGIREHNTIFHGGDDNNMEDQYMKMKSILFFMVISLFPSTVNSFTFRNISLNEPLSNQFKPCMEGSIETCYEKDETLNLYEIKNLSELSIPTQTFVKVYDNKIVKIEMSYSGKNSTEMFLIFTNKYGPPFTTRGIIPTNTFIDRKTGRRITYKTPGWIMKDCYIKMSEVDEDNIEKSKVTITSKDYLKISPTTRKDEDKL